MNKTNQKLLAHFLEEEKLAGRRKQGLTGLRNRVPKLLGYLEDQEIPVGRVAVKEALAYQGWLIESGRRDGKRFSNHTIAAYIIAASSFFDFARRKALVPANPFKEIRRLPQEKNLPRNLPNERDMYDFLEELAEWDRRSHLRNQKTKYRIHLIAELMYSTGLRISEVAGLKAGDLNFRKGIVYVREGKGGKPRVAYLGHFAGRVLKLYIRRLRPWLMTRRAEAPGDSLFGVGESWLQQQVNQNLKTYFAPLGYADFSSHAFRHCLGYHLHRAGCNIRYIQAILGHKRLRNTEIYTKVDKEDLRKIMDAHHPRRRIK